MNIRTEPEHADDTEGEDDTTDAILGALDSIAHSLETISAVAYAFASTNDAVRQDVDSMLEKLQQERESER
jgi:hypothetical protein